jgi:hypothetical protein
MGAEKQDRYTISLADSRGIVIGDRNVVIQHFTAGIEALATDYSVRVGNFLSEYLGTTKRPVPFGGRETELQELDRWLSDPAAPPYMLLTAPAGRGKSTLLVQWLRRLWANPNVNVTFVPISVRFRTNLASVVFAILAARLAKLVERQLPYGFGISAEEWRGVVSEFLTHVDFQQKPVVLVIDSMDEAADWQAGPDLFPLQPPTGLRIVVSARILAGHADAGAWLARLGWTRPGLARTLELPPLDRAGIVELLHEAGVFEQKPGADDHWSDLVSQLYRLTRGDPLLLALYVKHLTEPQSGAESLQRRDLPDLPPGLQGYMALWWEQQRQLWGENAGHREPAVKSLLNLLAGALGPLDRADLSALDPMLDTWTLGEVLPSVQRIVLGDGIRQGFAYSHPRLGAFIFDGLTPAEQQKLDQRFLQWGTDVVASLGTVDPVGEPVPTYLSQQYSAHLLRAKQCGALFALVGNNAWFHAQERADPSLSTFSEDVARAWTVAETANKASVKAGDRLTELHLELRCALAAGSVRSLSLNYPAAILTALVTTERWTRDEALQRARRNPDPTARAEVLSALAALLPEPEQIGVLREALESVRQIEGPAITRSALNNLVPRLTTLPLLEEAVGIIRTTCDGKERAETLAEVIRHFPDNRQTEILEEVLALIRDLPEIDRYWHHARGSTLIYLTRQLPDQCRKRVTEEALAYAEATASGEILAGFIAQLAPYLAEQVKSKALRSALAAVKNEPDQQGRWRALVALAPVLPEALLGEALRITKRLRWTHLRANVLEALVPRLPVPLLIQALKATKELKHPEERMQVFAPLVSRLAEVGKLELALSEARQITNPSWGRDALLAILAPRLAEVAGPEEGIDLAKTIDTNNEWSEWNRFLAWSGLVTVLPRPLWPQAIQQAITAVKSDTVQALLIKGGGQEQVGEFAIRISEAGFVKEALSLTRALPQRDSYDNPVRANSLTKLLATSRDGALRATVLPEALIAARAIHDHNEQALALTALGASLSADKRHDLHAAALAAVHAIPSPENRLDVLIKILPFLGGAEMQAAVTQAITDWHATEGYEQFRYARALARSLPPGAAHALVTKEFTAPVVDEADEERQLTIIREFSGSLSEALLAKALQCAKDIQDVPSRIKTVTALLPRLSSSGRIELLRQLLLDAAALEVVDESESSPRAEAFEDIAPHMEVGVLDQAEALVDSLAPDKSSHMQGLAALAPQLARLGRGHEALQAVRAIAWDWRREGALAAVIPHLPPSLLDQARMLADELGFPRRWESAVALVARLSDENAKTLLPEALVVIAAPNAWALGVDHRNLLPALAPRLTPSVVHRALALVGNLFTEAKRLEVSALALAVLAGLLPESDQNALFAEALATAEQINDPEKRASTLAKMSQYLPDALLQRALEGVCAARRSKSFRSDDAAEALATLVARLVGRSADELYPILSDAVRALAAHGRPGLLWDLSVLRSLLAALGGPQAISGVAHEVIDATRRWP